MYNRPNSIIQIQTMAYFAYVKTDILSIKHVNLFLEMLNR